MLKSNFRFRLINRTDDDFCFVEVDPQTVLRCFVYLQWLWLFPFFPFLSTGSNLLQLFKLFFRELKLQKRLLLTKATREAIHQSLMEEVVLNENWAVNFRFFFPTKIRFKKRKWKSHKSKRRWRKSVPFNKQTTTEQEDLSFTKQMLVLYN